MANESRLDERTGWGHVWSSSEWKRCFLVLTPGALRIFSCDQRNKIKRTLNLGGCSVGIQKPLSSQEASLARRSSNSRLWKNLAKLVASDDIFSQTDTAVVTIEPRKGKKCFLVFPSQKEAEVWKVGVEEAAALAESKSSKRGSKKSLKGCTTFDQASDAVNHTRIFLKRNSLLQKPFGLRWEAHPPLLKNKECNTDASRGLPQTKVEGEGAIDKVKVVEVISSDPLWHDLETLQGCTDFLRSSCLNFHALEHAALMVDHFKGSYQMGDSSLPDELRLEAWRGTMRRIVKSLVDQILANNPSLDSCAVNDDHMDQLWLACEVWVLGAVHDKIMGACKQMFAVNDASLDQILAKLQKVDPSTLGVRAEFENFVLGEALQQFRMLNRLRTPFEKALCLRKTVKCIIDGIQCLIKSCTGALKDTEGLLPCTDDLLSFMLLLMARAKVKNLQANACYMEIFLNLQREDTSRGELVYHITNFAAACNYLQSAAIQELVANISLTPINKVSPSSQNNKSADESSPVSQPLYKSPANSFSSRSTSNMSISQKHSMHLTSALSRSYILDSDADSRSRDDNKSEVFLEEPSCFDGEAFNNWRNSGRMQENRQADISEYTSVDGMWVAKDFSQETGTGWTETDDSRGSAELLGFPELTHRKAAFAFPGDLPDFILAPTYH